MNILGNWSKGILVLMLLQFNTVKGADLDDVRKNITNMKETIDRMVELLEEDALSDQLYTDLIKYLQSRLTLIRIDFRSYENHPFGNVDSWLQNINDKIEYLIRNMDRLYDVDIVNELITLAKDSHKLTTLENQSAEAQEILKGMEQLALDMIRNFKNGTWNREDLIKLLGSMAQKKIHAIKQMNPFLGKPLGFWYKVFREMDKILFNLSFESYSNTEKIKILKQLKLRVQRLERGLPRD